MLSNIKGKQHGFTIVELLIVIVVIAILAAITIVAYNGIQSRAKTSAAQSAAETLQKKAEAANAVVSSYPGSETPSGTVPAGDFESQSDSSLKGSGLTLGTPGSDKAPTVVGYQQCTSAGAKITYYDYTGSGSTKTISLGTPGTCSAAVTSTGAL